MSSPIKPPQTGPVDFAIITALKIERDAVRRRLEEEVTVQDENDPHTYYCGTVTAPASGEKYRVVVVKLLDMGNDEAATTTARIIPRWQPASVIMVGIAGGVPGKVNLGDVVVAEFCHYYELGKVTTQGEQNRPQMFPAHRLLLGRAQAYEAAEWRNDLQTPRPEAETPDSLQPDARFGHIASGEKVIADAKTLLRILKQNPKVLAVAMEGAGVARAVGHHDPTPRFIEVRGICDFADEHKNDNWQEFAADAAAAFVIGLLRTRPLAPICAEHLSVEEKSPLLIIRAQAMRPIAGDEVLSAFDDDLKGRDIETVPLEFTDLVVNDLLNDPETAARRLANPKGILFGALARRSEAELVFHGIAHIPLVVLAGHLVSDRQPVRLFDFHSKDWAWPQPAQNLPPLEIKGLPGKSIRKAGDAVVRFSVSYNADARQARIAVPRSCLEIELTVPHPERGIIQSEEQVHAYGREFRSVMDILSRFLLPNKRVHLFYAGPMALAFHMGQQISANMHPPVVVWNYRQGYGWGIDLSSAFSGESCIVYPPE